VINQLNGSIFFVMSSLNHHPHFNRLCLRHRIPFAKRPFKNIQIGLGRLTIFVKVGFFDRPTLEQGLESMIAHRLICVGFRGADCF
jgi:hypothetical protein